jgi:serine protease Do
VGDIILTFNGKEINSSAALPPMVGRTGVGQAVKLKVMREGSVETVNIKIGQLPEEDSPLLAGGEPDMPGKNLILGLELESLSEEQRKEMDLEKGGLLVKKVHDGPAKRSGINEGDVLQMINNEKITDINQFRDLVENLPKGKFASVLVRRSEGPEFIAMKIPE